MEGVQKGTKKGIFVFVPHAAYARICVTEGYIDALSMADLEDCEPGAAWLSVDGGFGERTASALDQFIRTAAGPPQMVVAADNDCGGSTIGDIIAAIAARSGAPVVKLRPQEGK